MSLEYQEKIYFNATYYSSSGNYYINETYSFEHDGHQWDFKIRMDKSILKSLSLTYNGRSTGSEQAVEMFGRIYVLDQKDVPVDLSYWIPRTQLNLVNNNVVVAQESTKNLESFIVNAKLRIRLQLYLKRTTTAVDSKLLKAYTNLTIIVDGVDFYISKEVLASVSSVFASMFEEDNETNEINVDDVNSDEFEVFLKVIQPGSRVDIPFDFVHGVLKIAHPYRMESIVAICESRLMFFCNGKMPMDDRKKYFSIACDFGFCRLQHKFIMTCPIADLQSLIDDSTADPKSDEVMKMVMDRLASDRGATGTQMWECPTTANEPLTTPVTLTIMINGTNLSASKEVLASASPTFAAMLFGDFEENKKNEIELDDDDSDNFAFLLQLLVPGSMLIVNDKNVMGVLKLADKYLIETVLNMCEEFLVEEFLEKHSIMESHMYLVVASQYRLRRLQSVFTSNCCPRDLRALLDTGLVDSLTSDVKKMVIDGFWPLSGSGVETWSFRAAGGLQKT